MTRTGRVGEHVRAAILEAAAELFARGGSSVSMGELARAADVSRATLYRYFPSRESLLAALAQAALEEASERLREAQLESVPFDEAIARAARALIAVKSRFVVLVQERVPFDRELVEEMVGRQLDALLVRGQADGRIRADLALEWLRASFRAQLQAASTYAASAGLGTEEAAALCVRQFLGGASG
jgi:TetR/AcrR family transcriptional repressor of mexCD-oprJ operon